MEYGNFKYAYVEFLKDQNSSIEDDYMVAIQRLHISVIPDTLPCRQNERSFIENYLRDGIKTGNTSPLYICGMPGIYIYIQPFILLCIKLCNEMKCINNLRNEVEAGTLENFSFIEINCLRLKSPADACKFIRVSVTLCVFVIIVCNIGWIRYAAVERIVRSTFVCTRSPKKISFVFFR